MTTGGARVRAAYPARRVPFDAALIAVLSSAGWAVMPAEGDSCLPGDPILTRDGWHQGCDPVMSHLLAVLPWLLAALAIAAWLTAGVAAGVWVVRRYRPPRHEVSR